MKVSAMIAQLQQYEPDADVLVGGYQVLMTIRDNEDGIHLEFVVDPAAPFPTELRIDKVEQESLDESPRPWSVVGDLRLNDDDDNYAWTTKVRDNAGVKALGDAVMFDPENSCFYAYTKTREQAQAVAAIAADLRGTVHIVED